MKNLAYMKNYNKIKVKWKIRLTLEFLLHVPVEFPKQNRPASVRKHGKLKQTKIEVKNEMNTYFFKVRGFPYMLMVTNLNHANIPYPTLELEHVRRFYHSIYLIKIKNTCIQLFCACTNQNILTASYWLRAC